MSEPLSVTPRLLLEVQDCPRCLGRYADSCSFCSGTGTWVDRRMFRERSTNLPAMPTSPAMPPMPLNRDYYVRYLGYARLGYETRAVLTPSRRYWSVGHLLRLQLPTWVPDPTTVGHRFMTKMYGQEGVEWAWCNEPVESRVVSDTVHLEPDDLEHDRINVRCSYVVLIGVDRYLNWTVLDVDAPLYVSKLAPRLTQSDSCTLAPGAHLVRLVETSALQGQAAALSFSKSSIEAIDGMFLTGPYTSTVAELRAADVKRDVSDWVAAQQDKAPTT